MPKPIFFLVIFSLFVSNRCISQEYCSKQYNSENGLTQNSVTELVQDKYGYIWFATQAGVTRFDGTKFILINSKQLPQMSSDRILWIGLTQEKTVAFQDESAKIFIQGENPLDFFPKEKEQGSIRNLPAFYTANLITYNLKDSPLKDPKKLDQCNLSMAAECSDSSSYLYYSDPQNKREYLLYVKNKQSIFLDDNRLQDSKLLQFGDTLCLLNRRGEAYFMLNGKILNDEMVQTDITFDNHENLLFFKQYDNYIINNNNLYEINLDQKLRLTKRLIIKDLPCNNIRSINKMFNGKIYAIGTDTDGLFLLYPKTIETIVYKENSSITHMNTYALLLKDKELITNEFKYNLSSQKFTHINGFERFFLFKDNQEFIYYSHRDQDGGSILYKTNKFTEAEVIGKFKNTLIAMIQDPTDSEKFYFITQMQIGYMDNKGIHVLFDVTNSKNKTFLQGSFQCFLLSDQQLLIGSTKGLYNFDIQTHKLIYYQSKTALNVRSLFEDPDKNIFCATYGDGPFLFRNKNSLIRLPQDSKQNLLYAHCFILDKSDRLWITSNNGLFVIPRQQILNHLKDRKLPVNYYSFDRLDGIVGYEFNGGCNPCAVKNNQNELFFPSLKGIVRVNTQAVDFIFPADSIIVDQIKVNNHLMSFPKGKLEFRSDYDNLTFYITTPFYGHRQNLHMEYMFEGKADEWEPITDGMINVRFYSPGDYSLLIRMIKHTSQVPEYTYNSVHFTILPAWYQSKYFYSLLAILFILVVWGIANRRQMALKRTNQQLEIMVKERVTELEALYKNLKVSNVELNTSKLNIQNLLLEKQYIFSILVHDLRSPLKYLYKIANMLVRNWETMPSKDAKLAVSKLSNSTKEMHYFTEELMSWLSSQNHDGNTVTEIINIDSVVQEVVGAYREILVDNNNLLTVAIDPDLVFQTNHLMVKCIVRNLLDNANKNTVNGHIFIESWKTMDHLILKVSDDGSGMTPEMLLKLNSYFNSNEGESFVNSQSGHVILKYAIQSLNGTINYHNTDSKLIVSVTL